MKRYEAEPSVFNNGAYEKSEWRPAYGDPTGASNYSYQSPGGNVAFYDTRMALDDYFEQRPDIFLLYVKMDNIC